MDKSLHIFILITIQKFGVIKKTNTFWLRWFGVLESFLITIMFKTLCCLIFLWNRKQVLGFFDE